MPVRDKATMRLIEFFIGTISYSFGRPIGGQGVNGDAFDAINDFSEEVYCRTITAIDWNRIILEAAGRCERTRDTDPDHWKEEDALASGIGKAFKDTDTLLRFTFCPQCLEQALLTFEKNGTGVEESTDLPDVHAVNGWPPTAPLRKAFGDWVLKRRKELEAYGAGNDDQD